MGSNDARRFRFDPAGMIIDHAAHARTACAAWSRSAMQSGQVTQRAFVVRPVLDEVANADDALDFTVIRASADDLPWPTSMRSEVGNLS
jgi:hypothetical protein